MIAVGLLMWERRHAVRPELPSRTLCGIHTGMADVGDVPGLTDFAGTGEGGLPACRRCLPMWRRVVDLKGTVKDSEIPGDNRTYRNGMMIMGRWATPGCRWVYFAERGGLVKIGYSANVPQRMDRLGARLLALLPGGERMERRMHGLFAEYRVHGEREWFHPGLSLVGFIESLHGDDPYFKVDLPDDYQRAECERLTALRRAEIEDDRTDREDRARQRLPMSSHVGFAEADRHAAEVIGRALGLAS